MQQALVRTRICPGPDRTGPAINIECARAVAHLAGATEVVFDGLGPIKDRQRFQRGLCDDDQVEEVFLLDPANG